MPHRLVLLVLLALLGVAGCNSVSQPGKRELQYMNPRGFGIKYFNNPEEENYATLGDTVVFFDTLHPEELAGNAKVDIDGTVLLPEVGNVHLAGLTRSEIEARLTERYSVYYEETDIVVDLKTKGKVYFVMGEVGKTGEQKHPGDLTVFQAVLRAKPDEQSANTGRILLIRPDPVDPVILRFNMKDMVPGGDSSFNYQVLAYDIIYVPPTMLAEFAYFLRSLLFPVEEVLRGVGGALLGVGGRRSFRRGRRNNNDFGGGF
ncbi:MAG: polysaccharide biosynthesis/export family protein [Planctomycetota bacterium]|nr:polysaccharide biosynthesis/export family protein [Planctomycetota bacterium]